ncbi:hypothetical protein CFK38_05595 [Brachybacterium vulturis]|uniref:Uncharacterized protein n=1 Tax=Brachybacterium vulturis TaxID=2017484 RepID=A0A291GKL9_9MICO|nr:hypothetical protein [Brachybacterium vulturis]ATG51063.1 hypothetical protein CFK38_05595 [Brachybacterium vulturis]
MKISHGLKRPMVAAAATALLLSGCSGSDGGPPAEAPSEGVQESSASASADASSEAASGGSGEAAGPDGALEAGIDPADPPEPIVSMTIDDGALNDEVKSLQVDFLGFEERGEVLIARWAITPTLSRPDATGLTFYDIRASSQYWMPYMIDLDNLVRYDVVWGEPDPLTSDYAAVHLTDGEPSYVFAAFPAPDTATKSVNLYFSSNSPRYVEVPVP